MRRAGAALGIGMALGASASAHRLDEYLQATILQIKKDRVSASILLMPGVAVYRRVIGRIDTNGDGTLSNAEKRLYGEKVLHDLSLSVDGKPLKSRLLFFRFPTTEAMKKGLGTIEIKFDAPILLLSGPRRLMFENRHQSPIGEYLVNCLESSDPALVFKGQKRNYRQSRYELDYVQA